VAVHESEYPDGGTITIAWKVSLINVRRRLAWEFSSDPVLDRRLAIALLRDVANELDEDDHPTSDA